MNGQERRLRKGETVSVATGKVCPPPAAPMRKYYLDQHYGLTEEQYWAMVDRQHNRCAICGRHASAVKGGKLEIDHCHDSGRVRGLLCGGCNRGLGAFSDNPKRLRAAAEYLGPEYEEEK